MRARKEAQKQEGTALKRGGFDRKAFNSDNESTASIRSRVSGKAYPTLGHSRPVYPPA